MKSLGNFPDRFLAEIAGQPEAILTAARAAAEQRDAFAAVAAAAAIADSIVFTGMGSSHFACYAPVTTLAGAGIPSFMIDAAELLHFRMPVVTERTLVICVSQSGRERRAGAGGPSAGRSRPPPHAGLDHQRRSKLTRRRR